jgi:hypothetical protein
MMSHSLYRRVARSLGMILAGGIAAVSVPSFAGEAQWVEVKSPHFSVVTDGGEKRGRDVAVRFEQMRAVYGALLVKSNVNLPVPLQIVAFRNTKELRQFAPLWNGKPTQVAGLFLGNTDRSFILLDLSVDNPWTVVFHEYAHQLMDGNLPEHMDAWFEEGFGSSKTPRPTTRTETGEPGSMRNPQSWCTTCMTTGWWRSWRPISRWCGTRKCG